MKQLRLAVFLLLFILPCYASASVWQKSTSVSEPSNEVYSETYSTMYCSIMAYKDGTGLQVTARDFLNWEPSWTIVGHKVYISADLDTEVSFEEEWFEVSNGIAYNISVFGRDKSEDIVTRQCMPFVKDLPLPIQKLLLLYHKKQL